MPPEKVTTTHILDALDSLKREHDDECALKHLKDEYVEHIVNHSEDEDVECDCGADDENAPLAKVRERVERLVKVVVWYHWTEKHDHGWRAGETLRSLGISTTDQAGKT